MTDEPYRAELRTVGFLEQQEITVVPMDRSTFVGIVSNALSDGYDDLREELMPIAETMVRFPLGVWIDPTRGCGCIAGEYLIASSAMSRGQLAHAEMDDVEDLIRELRPGLRRFGLLVDLRLRNHLRAIGVELDGDRIDVNVVTLTIAIEIA